MDRRTFHSALVLAAATAASTFAQTQTPPAAAAAAASNLAVTVNYTGKGPVDASHGILVFLFDTPNITGQSQPIAAAQTITKNGGTATFTNIGAATVYVAVVYNEKGDYDGIGGPPPVGTPVAIHSKDTKDLNSPPLGVVTGPKATVKISFSDATRFGG
jgi:hypothetical protein